jgi:hypothetical protein
LVKDTIAEDTHFRIIEEQHALSKDGARYFGLMQLANGEADTDCGTVVGLRNSHDKAFSAGMLMGNGVFVCDNLSFFAEQKIARKHTTNIMRDLPAMVAKCVGGLTQMRHSQQARIDWYKQQEFGTLDVHDILVKSVDAQVVGGGKIPHILKEWREPRHPEFVECRDSAWHLFNCYTEVLKSIGREGPVWNLPARTQALHGLFDVHTGFLGAESQAEAVA